MTDKLPETSKVVLDRYKPWFDYTGCILGACAWLFATGSVAVLNYQSKTDWLDAAFWFTNLAIVPAFAYWVFLIVLLYKMTRELGLIPIQHIGKTGWRFSLYARVFLFWYLVGMISFIVSFVSHLAWVALGLYER